MRLKGGPFDGATVEVYWGDTLTAEGPPLPAGTCARYRPSREQGVYTFRGKSRIVARIPMPGTVAT